jgi:ABC-type sugar transport system ATPase subunit
MPHLVLTHITKQFPGVKALDDVSMSIEQGEIHALCGENGAGKSTLMNILSGNLQPDKGGIFLDGANVSFKNPQQAFAHNIAIVYQHLSLIDSLSVAENIFANQQPVSKWGIIQFEALDHQTSLLLKQLNIEEIRPRTLVAELSPAQRQMVEIAKALSKQPSIFILDEPTASLTDKETRTLFDILKTLKKRGASIIYISHRLEEIFVLADRISILKDGKYQGTFNASELKKDELITKMVGRELKALRAGSTRTTETLLAVKNISGSRFSNVSFSLDRGEIVGLAGLVGAGRSEIARAIFGIDKIRSGEILYHDKPFHADHPAAAIRERMAYVTEDRKNEGLFQEMTIEENIVAASLPFVMKSGLYDRSKVKEVSDETKSRFRIAASHPQQRVINLSGGNQQKVMLAKWLLTHPDVLIIDEPTHGIDIGAKYEIYEILKKLAAEGKAILMISSELPELIGLCDRIIVVKKGTVVGQVTPPDMTEEKVISLAT